MRTVESTSVWEASVVLPIPGLAFISALQDRLRCEACIAFPSPHTIDPSLSKNHDIHIKFTHQAMTSLSSPSESSMLSSTSTFPFSRGNLHRPGLFRWFHLVGMDGIDRMTSTAFSFRLW